MRDNILLKIGETKRMEVAAMKERIPCGIMRELVELFRRPVISMTGMIRRHDIAVIAEHKRRSPSKGEISPMSDVAEVAREYSVGGAAAMSVLTDTPYFGGSLTDLAVARDAAPSLPLLRKEFIVDEYQLYQARLYGADAVLLIAAMLGEGELARLNGKAHELGLQTLVELHSADEVAALPADADMAGINNRDLTSFSVDISNCERLIGCLPPDMVKVAESGIKTPADLRRLKGAGFDAFLIGEALMSTGKPGETLQRFLR